MLIYLRGETSAEERAESKNSLTGGAGRLFDGPSPFVSAARFGRFITACLARTRRFPLGEDDRPFFDYSGKQDPVNSGTPLSAGMVCWHSAAAISRAVARDSIAITCAAATEDDWFEWGFSGGPPDPLYQATMTGEYREQARLLREVIGNPFRPAFIYPAWRAANDRAAVRIAEQIDEQEDFDSVPILADALEDAGCAAADILAHLRSPGPHVRGCWVVDAILAKE
jgi:hypothetical protein